MSQPQPDQPLDLDAIQVRCDAASPGVSTDYVTLVISRTCRYGLLGHPEPLMTQAEAEAYMNGGGRGFAEGDAPFHANAYRDVAALLDRVRQLETTLAGPLWLAEYEGADPTLWPTQDTARACCEDLARTDLTSWDWITEDDGAQQIVLIDPDTDRPLHQGPGRITPLTIQQPAT